MPRIYVVCGIPASGKSYGVAQAKAQGRLTGEVVELDDVAFDYRGDRFRTDDPIERRDILYFTINRVRSLILNNQDVILIVAAYTQAVYNHLYRHLQVLKVPISFIQVKPSLLTCLQYNAKKIYRSRGCACPEIIIQKYRCIEDIPT